jgi:hypothetical protein
MVEKVATLLEDEIWNPFPRERKEETGMIIRTHLTPGDAASSGAFTLERLLTDEEGHYPDGWTTESAGERTRVEQLEGCA